MLLVQSCSKSKKQAEEPVPALELYSGYFYKIIKKARREGKIRPDLDIRILSAKYGLLEPDTEITTYDLRMDSKRAAELSDSVPDELAAIVETTKHNQILVNMGKEYQQAIAGFDSHIDANVKYLSGRLGERGSKLKQIIRTPKSENSPINVA